MPGYNQSKINSINKIKQEIILVLAAAKLARRLEEEKKQKIMEQVNAAETIKEVSGLKVYSNHNKMDSSL